MGSEEFWSLLVICRLYSVILELGEFIFSFIFLFIKILLFFEMLIIIYIEFKI